MKLNLFKVAQRLKYAYLSEDEARKKEMDMDKFAKLRKVKEKLEKKPEQVIELAVKGMLPKGPLGRQMFTKLHVYAGPDHKHEAQKPEVLTF